MVSTWSLKFPRPSRLLIAEHANVTIIHLRSGGMTNPSMDPNAPAQGAQAIDVQVMFYSRCSNKLPSCSSKLQTLLCSKHNSWHKYWHNWLPSLCSIKLQTSLLFRHSSWHRYQHSQLHHAAASCRHHCSWDTAYGAGTGAASHQHAAASCRHQCPLSTACSAGTGTAGCHHAAASCRHHCSRGTACGTGTGTASCHQPSIGL